MSVVGLRERKKHETHSRIQAAALDLFARDGFHATTIAAIAQAADVAPRTVSLHFPAKEDLVFHPDPPFEELRRCLDERPPGEPALDAMRRWLIRELRARDAALDAEERRAEWERARTRQAIIDAEPDLQERERGQLQRAEQLLARAVAHDTGDDPGDLRPMMAASAAVAVFAMLKRIRAGGETHPPTIEESVAVVDRVFDFLRGGLAALGDPGPLRRR